MITTRKTTTARLMGSVLLGMSITGAGVLAPGSDAMAANWFKLRGTEPGGIAHTLQMWGFLQPTYANDFSDEIDIPVGVGPPPLQGLNGEDITPGTIPPDRSSDESFFMRRARFGIRGTMIPISNDIDYFFLTEWGENGITRGGGAAHLLDASVTFNQLSRGMDDDGLANLGARFRVGQFLFSQTSESLSHSTPGRRVHIFMPEATLAFALNRPTFDNANDNFPGDVSVNGARDMGIEVFDWVEWGDPAAPYEFTYSAAVGNGGTIGEQNRDDNLRTYAWLSFAKLFDSTRGARRHDAMIYGFYQNGDREFNDDVNNDGVSDNSQINPLVGFTGGLCSSADDPGDLCKNGNERDYEQEYWGVGVEYFDKPFPNLGQIRFEAEYQKQEGMVFDGAISPSATRFRRLDGVRYNVDGESDGWYVDLGYDIHQHLGLKNRTTINARYDRLRRNKDDPARAVQFDTLSLTGEYFFHKKARLALTYQARDFDANDRNGGPRAVGNEILDGIDHRIGVQVTFIFKNVLLR